MVRKGGKGRDAWSAEVMRVHNDTNDANQKLWKKYQNKYPKLQYNDVIVMTNTAMRVKGGKIYTL